MTTKVFIDGNAGTTGLQIAARLATRADITLIQPDETQRKDRAARAEFLNKADLAILCLPDDAAIEAVGLIESNSVRVIDASTAHRTNEICAIYPITPSSNMGEFADDVIRRGRSCSCGL